MALGDSLWRMVLGVWFWVYCFGRIVWLWVYAFWGYDFSRMVLGVWFDFGHMVWLWEYGFGRMHQQKNHLAPHLSPLTLCAGRSRRL